MCTSDSACSLFTRNAADKGWPSSTVPYEELSSTPGAGTVPLMKDLYLAFRANTIDHVIETTPNDARYFVGYVGWRPGELKSEIDRGLWTFLNADLDMVFRKDTEGLWEELQQSSKRIRAGSPETLHLASILR